MKIEHIVFLGNLRGKLVATNVYTDILHCSISKKTVLDETVTKFRSRLYSSRLQKAGNLFFLYVWFKRDLKRISRIVNWVLENTNENLAAAFSLGLSFQD